MIMTVSSQPYNHTTKRKFHYLLLGLLLLILPTFNNNINRNLCFVESASQNTADNDEPNETIEHGKYYDACARGQLDVVKDYVSRNPELVKAATNDGETCLHLTAISKSLDIAEFLLSNGADPNHRVTHEQGLRMMPLSWHAWGGNVEIIRALLDAGADINADFEYSKKSGSKVTATDVVKIVADASGKGPASEESKRFVESYELLVSRGGKTYEELFPDSPHVMSKETSEKKIGEVDEEDEFLD